MKKLLFTLIPLTMGCFLTINGKPVNPGGSAGEPAQANAGESGPPSAPAGSTGGGSVFDGIRPPGSQEDGWRYASARDGDWIRKCLADYLDFRKRWTPAEERLRVELKNIMAESGFYGRYAKLVALRGSLIEEATKLGLYEGASGTMLLNSGVAFEIEKAVVVVQRETKHEHFQVKPEVGKGFEWFEDDRLNADIYCGEIAVWRGTHNATGTLTGGPNVFMEYMPQDRVDRMRSTLNKIRQENPVTFKIAPPGGPYLRLKDAIRGELVEFYGTVKSVAGTPGAHRVTAVNEGARASDKNCRESDKVEAIEANGRLRRQTVCDRTVKGHQWIATLTLDELPTTGVSAGDNITIRGKLRSRQDVSGGTEFEVEGHLVVKVERAGALVHTFE